MDVHQVFSAVGQNLEIRLAVHYTFESLINSNMFLALLPLTMIAAAVLLYQRRIAEASAKVNVGK